VQNQTIFKVLGVETETENMVIPKAYTAVEVSDD
jgi:hypothetical protein